MRERKKGRTLVVCSSLKWLASCVCVFVAVEQGKMQDAKWSFRPDDDDGDGNGGK